MPPLRCMHCRRRTDNRCEACGEAVCSECMLPEDQRHARHLRLVPPPDPVAFETSVPEDTPIA